MTEREVERALGDADLVIAVQGKMVDIKRIRRQCLDVGIPATAVKPPDGNGGS